MGLRWSCYYSNNCYYVEHANIPDIAGQLNQQQQQHQVGGGRGSCCKLLLLMISFYEYECRPIPL